MKQFLYAINQHSETRIDIHCKVTFGFKYINQDPTTLGWNKMCPQQQDPYWNAGATEI